MTHLSRPKTSLPALMAACACLAPAFPVLSDAARAHAAAAPAAPAPAAYQFLEDEAEPQFNLTFSVAPGSAASGSLTTVFDHRDDKNFYALDVASKSVALRAVVAGVSRPLGSAPARVRADSTVTLQRRAWLMQVVVDRRVALTAYDATFDAGKIGSRAAGGWSWKDPRVQPVEEIYFADDFTRADITQNADWKTTGGGWKLTSASPTITVANREMSANPFSYQVTAPLGRALAQAGRWFWDDYEASVSVRPMSRGAVGLAVYVQDAKNYLALVWNASEGPQARQLVRVTEGRSTVLARSAGAYLPRQWYRLSVRTSPGYIEALIDGTPVFAARNDWFGQGGIALLAHNVTAANFDDARVKSHPSYRLDFVASDSTISGGGWTPHKGAWSAKNRVLTSGPAPGDGGATRVMLTGRSNWNRYQMTAAAQAGGSGACGLLVGYADEKDYAVFRWAGAGSKLPFRGRQQLLRVRNGQAKIINDAPLNLQMADDGFARVTVRLAAGAFTVYGGDGDIVAQMTDESLASGRAGLWSQGAGLAAFRDVAVEFLSEPPPPQIAPRMAADALMVQYGWASPAGEWKPSNGDNGPELWNNGDFFGDASLEFAWPRAATGKLELSLRAQRGQFDSGWIVRCEGSGEGKPLRLTLLRGGKVLKQREFTPKPKNAGGAAANAAGGDRIPLRVDIEGRALMLSVGGQPALSYLSSSRSNADHAAVGFAARAKGFALEAKDLRAISPHRDDYTFTEAPTDWYAAQGNWGVIARWPCTSDWSFFGTKGIAPVLWSKRVFNDDVVVEAYMHNQMDSPTPPYYSKAGNLNITIAGDGKNPLSGYSFLFAGWHNTKAAILKGRQVVVENATPKGRYENPAAGGNMRFHRSWTYIRVEVRRARKDGRDGALATFTVNDEKIAEYFDPSPTADFGDNGRVAFWTVNSTLSIARVKIESASNNPRSLPAGLLDATPPAPQKPPSGIIDLVPRPRLDDGLASALVELEADARASAPAWTVRDPASGGIFAVQLAKPSEALDKTSTWQATPDTRLDMELALGAETKIDLYVTVDGARHLVMLSGIPKSESGKSDGDVKLLGDARGSMQPIAASVDSTPGERNWQHVSFDLGKALQKLYPGASRWNITEIALGALHGDDYRWVGLHGNPMGATYRLRRARLSESAREPAKGPTPEAVK